MSYDARKITCEQCPLNKVSSNHITHCDSYCEKMAEFCSNIDQDSYHRGYIDGTKKIELRYEQGLNDAWEIAKLITHNESNYLKEIFGRNTYNSIFEYDTAKGAIEKYNKWKEEKELHVGDIITLSTTEECVITFRSSNEIIVMFANGDMMECNKDYYKDIITKTGRNIKDKLEEFMENIETDDKN